MYCGAFVLLHPIAPHYIYKLFPKMNPKLGPWTVPCLSRMADKVIMTLANQSSEICTWQLICLSKRLHNITLVSSTPRDLVSRSLWLAWGPKEIGCTQWGLLGKILHFYDSCIESQSDHRDVKRFFPHPWYLFILSFAEILVYKHDDDVVWYRIYNYHAFEWCAD